MALRLITPVSATALGLILLASPTLAETIRGEGKVVHATLYPEGATVTRQTVVQVPAGRHQIVIPGLPADTDPTSLRLQAVGATIGAVSVQTGRALPADVAEPAAVTGAKAALEAAEKALRDHDNAARSILARAEAAKETVAFLRDLATSEGALATDLTTLVGTVQTQLLAAKEAALQAEAEAANMAPARVPLVEAVEKARAALAAVDPPEGERAALVVEIEAPAAGPVTIEADTLDPRASWAPVYDVRLDREAGTLALDRGVLVRQDTGEDWQGVALTMSTSRPTEQAMPSELNSEIVATVEEEDDDGAAAEMSQGYVAPVVDVAPVVVDAKTGDLGRVAAKAFAAPRMQGLNLVFDYPRPADIRSGVDGLRLALDSKALQPTIRAEAVPLYDTRATLVAETVNSDEILLPGTASLYADGALVGTAELDTAAAGDKLVFGFGPIDGLTIERRTADRSQGDRGLITRSDTDAETVEIEVKNLTTRDWPLRVIDRVPVSEEEDLRVAWTAEPQPTEQDPDGKRGVLYWDQTLAKGVTQTIRLTTDISWPAGRRLLR